MMEIILLSISVLLNLFLSYRLLWRLKRVLIRKKRTVAFYEALHKEELIHVYTDVENNKWFTWSSPTLLPPERGIMSELAANQLDMNITRETLIQYITKIKQDINEGQLIKVAETVGKIEDRLTWIAEEKCLLSFAKIYFIIEGENLRQPSKDDDRRKSHILDNDPEARAFFLRGAWRLTKLYSDFSGVDIQQYLMTKQGEESNMTSM